MVGVDAYVDTDDHKDAFEEIYKLAQASAGPTVEIKLIDGLGRRLRSAKMHDAVAFADGLLRWAGLAMPLAQRTERRAEGSIFAAGLSPAGGKCPCGAPLVTDAPEPMPIVADLHIPEGSAPGTGAGAGAGAGAVTEQSMSEVFDGTCRAIAAVKLVQLSCSHAACRSGLDRKEPAEYSGDSSSVLASAPALLACSLARSTLSRESFLAVRTRDGCGLHCSPCLAQAVGNHDATGGESRSGCRRAGPGQLGAMPAGIPVRCSGRCRCGSGASQLLRRASTTHCSLLERLCCGWPQRRMIAVAPWLSL